MASTRKRKKLPKSVYKRRQRNLILAMIGILLVLILSLVLVIRRHGEDTPPDAPGTTAASEASTEPVSDPVPEASTPGTEDTDPAKGEIHMRDSQITLTVGESRRLQATDASDDAAKAVWSSSDSRIAAVSADGAVIAVAPGS